MKQDIFSYEDHLLLFKERIDYLRAVDSKLSYRSLSKKIGLKSSSFLHHFLDGSKQASEEIIDKICDAVDFTGDEKRFAMLLTQLGQSQASFERAYYAKQIFKLRGYKSRFPLSAAQLSLYENWYYVPFLELLGNKKFVCTRENLNHLLSLQLTESDFKKMVENLTQLGLIKESASGKIIKNKGNIELESGIASHLVTDFHSKMISLAKQSLETMDDNEREVLSLTFSMSRTKYDEVSQLARDFYSDMFELLSKHDSDAEDVFQLNIQLFPLTKNN